MEDNKIIIEIEKLIKWYSTNYAKAPIGQLMDLKSKLVTYIYNLGELLARWKREYNFRYYIRKIAISRTKNAMIKNGDAISKAESIATEQEADKFESELEAEHLAYSIELKLRQSNKIVEDLTQRIAVLRTEKETHIGD